MKCLNSKAPSRGGPEHKETHTPQTQKLVNYKCTWYCDNSRCLGDILEISWGEESIEFAGSWFSERWQSGTSRRKRLPTERHHLRPINPNTHTQTHTKTHKTHTHTHKQTNTLTQTQTQTHKTNTLKRQLLQIQKYKKGRKLSFTRKTELTSQTSHRIYSISCA